MAGALAAAFSKRFRLVSYAPELTGEGAMVWEEVGPDGTKIRHQAEPGTNPFSLLMLWLLGLLPIEWLLLSANARPARGTASAAETVLQGLFTKILALNDIRY